MIRLHFYRLAVPAWLGLQRLRAVVLWIWTRRVLRGLLAGRWPWEVIAEIREEQRRVRRAVDRIFAPIEAEILGERGRGRAKT